jgi:phosphate acetyltransferase
VTDIIEVLKTRARQRGGRVVLPEGDEPRIAAAARALLDEGIATPVLLCEEAALVKACAQASVAREGLERIDPARSERLADYARIYMAQRPKASPKVAQRAAGKPMFFASLMVKAGDADAMVAGVSCATGRVIEAGLMGVGLAPGIATPSSFFLMSVPDFAGAGRRSFIFADCAVNVEPSPEELADIAIASAASAAALLGTTPRVAMLSFSTLGSARHARVDRVTQALALVRERAPGLKVDGELQLDAALVPRVARDKVKRESEVAGQANVLIFPDLDAGNIGYKLTQYMGNALAVGPVLQGFARPVADLSRGASVQDVVATTAIALVQGGSRSGDLRGGAGCS